jgi:hypothetical protein
MIAGGQLSPMISAVAATLALLIAESGHAQVPMPPMEGPYMGQAPPGKTPEIFLPGVLNRGATGDFGTVFSAELDEFFFVIYQKDTEGTMQMHRMASTVPSPTVTSTGRLSTSPHCSTRTSSTETCSSPPTRAT